MQVTRSPAVVIGSSGPGMARSSESERDAQLERRADHGDGRPAHAALLLHFTLIRPSGTFSRREKEKPSHPPASKRTHQTRLNTRVPLVPPKPKPFDIATSIFASRAVFGT